MSRLQENLSALQDMRLNSAAKRRKRMGQLTALVASIPDPTPDTPEDSAPRPASPVGGGGGLQKNPHSMNDGHGHGSVAEVKGLNAEFNKQLGAFLKAAGGKIKVNSGYRDPKRQAQLFAAAVKKYGSEAAARKWVAPPGKSNHNHGLAADLGYSDAEARKWAHANAAKYGLVFPLAHEPWHIEPVNARKKRK